MYCDSELKCDKTLDGTGHCINRAGLGDDGNRILNVDDHHAVEMVRRVTRSL